MGRIVHQFLQMFIHREYLLIITQSKRLIGDNQVVLQVVIELLRVSLECAEDQNIAKLHDRKKYAEQYPHAWRRCEVQTRIICEYISYFVQDEKINNISNTPVIIDEGMGISIYNQDFDENNMNVTVDRKFKFWKPGNAILILKDDIEERVLNAYRINDLNNLLFLGDDFVGIEFKNLNQEEMIEIKNSKCLP